MRLTWMGTAALLLEQGGTTIAFDPFPGLPMGARPGRALPGAAPFQKASEVFVTHGHFDHILYIPELYRDTEAVIHATATPRDTLLGRGMPEERLRLIAPGWEGGAGPFHIRAWQSRHCRFDAPMVLRTILQGRLWAHLPHMVRLLALNRAYRENGEILFYELTDGRVRVQVMGSMNLRADVDYPTGADVLVLPFQGRSDMEAYALALVQRLRPKRVLLDHYDDAFPPLTIEVLTGPFTELVEEQLGIPCQALTKYETITI